MNFQIRQLITEAEARYNYQQISDNFQVYDKFAETLVELTARHCIHLAFLNSNQTSKAIAKEFDIPLDDYDHSEYYYDLDRNR
jgi:hypothetical protein